MYKDVLKYETIDIEFEYYADKEHAYDMVLFFDKSVREKVTETKIKEHAAKKEEKIKKQEIADAKANGTYVEEVKEEAPTAESATETEPEPVEKKKRKKNK